MSERCFSPWLCLQYCVCSVQTRPLRVEVRGVERQMVWPGQTSWVPAPADEEPGKSAFDKSDSAHTLACWSVGFLMLLYFTWVSAIFLFFHFFPTIETVDVIIHNKMKLKQLVRNDCKIFNLWQMIDLSKLSATWNFNLNLCHGINIFAVICAVLKGYSAAWDTEEFLSTRCWNSPELFIHFYALTKYFGTKSFCVFIQLCFARVLQTGVPVCWHKSFNL